MDQQPRQLPRLTYELRTALAAAKARAQVTARRVRRIDVLSRDHIAADLAAVSTATDRATALVAEIEDRPPAPLGGGEPCSSAGA